MTDKQELGKKGEKAVAKYLKRKRFKILERNYSCIYGEIDIIAENKKYLVFVEVKTRKAGQMLEPRFSVDYKKRNRIIRTAARFLSDYSTEKQPRLDVAEVVVNEKGKLEITYIDNAFEQEGDYAPF
ncbi:MAG: YraN family protein [Ruminococcus sp.]|nr:YraN family protein [Ruminococcus sp.]